LSGTESKGVLTGRGFAILKDLVASAVLFVLFVLGFWALEQTLDSVVSLKRGYVDLPISGVRMDVWSYHDFAYVLLWVAFVGVVLFEAAHWKPFRLTVGRVVIPLLGFVFLTAGLWLSQDIMNAVLVLGRDYVDLPFFMAKPDLLVTRDLVTLLVVLGFLSFHSLSRLADR
jgi:hypothetical protein